MIEMAIKLSNEPSQRQTLAHASFSCPTPKPHEGCKLVHRSSINQLKKKQVVLVGVEETPRDIQYEDLQKFL